MPVYKYFDKETYARRFLRKGEILLRPLAYYRALEIEEGGRGDRWDGVLRYAPTDGLLLTFEGGLTAKSQDTFISSVRQDEVFVWCASNEFSAEVAAIFGRYCVEIEPDLIVNRLKLRSHAASALDYSNIVSDSVEYRAVERAPLADWALPKKVALIKPDEFSRQNEYRIVLGKHRALDVENVEIGFFNAGEARSAPSNTSKILLKLGNLESHARFHEF
tara:strand:- start:148 stop:804 length:657 start_codon:yes stop_codon:yes gene_type:complete